MTQPFEDFLVDLANKGDPSVLDRLDGYLDGHLARSSNAAAERQRLAIAFRDRAPETELSRLMLDRIVNGGEDAEYRAIAKARADIAAGRGVSHAKVREWLLKLRDGKVEPPPCA